MFAGISIFTLSATHSNAVIETAAGSIHAVYNLSGKMDEKCSLLWG